MKAIALISGGLDSILAAKVVKDLGIEVIGVYFKIPFALRQKKPGPSFAEALTSASGIEMKTIVLGDEFLQIVRHPKHGHGANVNPCIDCKILMLKKAKELMQELGASFLITGEVLGQRPMSQHVRALNLIAEDAGVKDCILRPLSAKVLEPSLPEQKGWVDRDKLFDFNGRSRKPQIDLAVMIGVIDYPNAAGGCLLTEPRFAVRLRDLFKRGKYDLDNVALLKLGRHYRISDSVKLVVGRDIRDNEEIEKLAQEGDYLFFPPLDIAGPTALARGELTEAQIELCAGVNARYCDLNGKETIDIICRKFPLKEERILSSAPIPDEESVKYRL
ncbi:MAG: tRNA 4-thiouridine(8) synthase ThiI [Candidatus Omnitrophica bacterium]|jgi:tRNA U34 2-thiouridine synthase MnmA/TrmU|nr:tRNA 4-thiouridine(8) synthase ThiI [Candidatus Omnitrophota bacterium]